MSWPIIYLHVLECEAKKMTQFCRLFIMLDKTNVKAPIWGVYLYDIFIV